MLADFEIIIRDVYKPLGVRVVVHDSIRAMRSAVTQQDKRWFGDDARVNEINNYLAICQRYHLQDSDIYSTVRFAPPNLGAGIIAHEFTHCAVWFWEIKHKFKATRISADHEDEEWFAWIVGELVRQTTKKFYEEGIYD